MVHVVGPSGLVIDLEDGMAACLVDAGHASYADVPVVETVPAALTEKVIGEAEPVPVGVESEPGAEVVAGTVVETVPADAPRGNASREEFAAFATALGIEFDADASRDEIRALVAGKE